MYFSTIKKEVENMKNFILFVTLVMLVFATCGCDMNMDNTPIKKVEALLSKYQTLDDDVLEDLDNTLAKDTSLDDDLRNEYREFMKKHYQDLEYEIKDETIDGNIAIVTAEITVRDYSGVVIDATAYRLNNEEEFTDEDGNYNNLLFSNYRLDRLKEIEDTVTYTIEFNLTKDNDEWVVEQLSSEDMSKINGLYVN